MCACGVNACWEVGSGSALSDCRQGLWHDICALRLSVCQCRFDQVRVSLPECGVLSGLHSCFLILPPCVCMGEWFSVAAEPICQHLGLVLAWLVLFCGLRVSWRRGRMPADVEKVTALKTQLGSLAGLRKGNVLEDGGEDRTWWRRCIALCLRWARPWGQVQFCKIRELRWCRNNQAFCVRFCPLQMWCPHVRNR